MTTKTGILYLQRDKFQMYSPYLPSLLEFRFVPELIRDYDLINRQLLENLLKVFIANNKIPPSSLVIIIADSASFMKDFVSPPPLVVTNQVQAATPPPTLEDLRNQATQYFEHIPFEIVASKIFPLATGVRAYATNQEIYEGLRIILEKQGFIIQSVLPGFIFGPNLSNRPTLDGTSISIMLQKLSTLQGYNLLNESSFASDAVLPEDTEEKEEAKANDEASPLEKLEKPENKKVFMAVAISAIVIIVGITVLVLYFQFQQKPYVPPSAPAKQVSVPTVTPQNSQGVDSQALKDLTVQITSPASQASRAATLRSTFTSFGFKSVIPQTQNTVGASSNLLLFSSRVSQQVRTSVTESVKQVIPDILVQERADASFDVTVILGK